MRLFLNGMVFSGSLFVMALPVVASCLGSGDAGIERLAQDIGRQPYQALHAIEQALSAGQNLSIERRAWLEAARAQAKRMTGQEKTELPAALAAAQALPEGHPALLHLQIASLYGADLLQPLHDTIKDLRRQIGLLSAHQPTMLCLQIRLASVMADREELNGETFELAADTYRQAAGNELAWMRAEAASVLGQIVLRTDPSYARTLSEEARHYFESQAMHDMVANELFMDALSWAAQRDNDSLQKAAGQFRRSEEAARLANNPFGAAYAEAGLCGVLSPLGKVQEALHSCHVSLQQLKGIGHVTEYSALINYAAALLADNRPEQAMALLAPMAAEWPGFDAGYYGYRFYAVRGQTYEAIGNTKAALADLKLALRELRNYESSGWARHNRLTQSRFRVEQLAQSLEQQTRESEEREHRNRLLLGAGLLVLSLLCVIVFTLINHRRLYRRMAYTDLLTGAANRRYTEVRAQEAFESARARQQPLYIALLDLDRFKSCNDRYGHDAGDEALKRFVSVAESVLRPGDLFGRWGGEEFLLILQNIDQDGATAVLNRLRSAAAAEQLTLAPDYPLQFSAGVARFQQSATRLADLLLAADQALYRAKAEGRNRSCFADG